MLPVSVVEGEGLKELFRYFALKYVMPSRASVTKRIEKHFEKDELKVKLTRADKLALTTDCWTALTN